LKDLAARVDPSRNESELDVDKEAWVRVVLRASIKGSRMVILGDPHRLRGVGKL
jgi:hypothetical protein